MGSIAKCLVCPECGTRELTHWYGCSDVRRFDSGAACCWACYIAYCAFAEMVW